MILREFLGIFSDFFIWRVLSENKVIHLPNLLCFPRFGSSQGSQWAVTGNVSNIF